MSGPDVPSYAQLLALLDLLRADNERLVEQNARAGLAIAHHGAVLDSGRVALTGAGSQLLEDPRVAELYLGGAPS